MHRVPLSPANNANPYNTDDPPGNHGRKMVVQANNRSGFVARMVKSCRLHWIILARGTEGVFGAEGQSFLGPNSVALFENANNHASLDQLNFDILYPEDSELYRNSSWRLCS
jgi:hypothetical protein